MENAVRHGDVPLHRLADLPVGATKLKHDGSFTLALGEVTGHHHTLYPSSVKDMEVYKVGETFIVHLKVDTPLRHQEHHEVIVPAGIWSVGMEQQYDPFTRRMARTID